MKGDVPAKGWHGRGYLPHLDAAGVVQHVTFHLADSMPREAVQRSLADVDLLPSESHQRARRARMHAMLDAGYGSCLLGDGRCAACMQDTLRYGDGDRYRLLAWVIMPNHVHVLVETKAGWPLGKLVQRWKRHTTKCFDRLALGLARPYWQRDYWDRFVRDDRQYAAVVAYIESNPVKAGLVERPEDWPWSSASPGVRRDHAGRGV
jgi:type I restriction enzyme R subunit/putative DNA methylase